jgi:alpha-galactosidase
MEKLFKDIHAMGLRVGLYSSPMIFTWGSAIPVLYQGSTTFPVDWTETGHHYPIGKTLKEAADAELWATWGVDYIKYDWGNYTKPKFAKRMREALDATGRDVYLSVCTECLVEDAEEHAKYAQIVRGNRDLIDEWKMNTEKPRGVADLLKFQKPWLEHIRPGFWYDLDMMSLGPMYLGSHGKILGDNLIGNNLTHNEAAFHFIYWAFCCNPIHLSCRMGELDKFTLDLISNEEIIEVMTDYPASAPKFEKRSQVLVGTRTLSDGRKAVGYFNLSDEGREIDGMYLPPHFAKLKVSSF